MTCTPYDFFLWAALGFVVAMICVNLIEIRRLLRNRRTHD